MKHLYFSLCVITLLCGNAFAGPTPAEEEWINLIVKQAQECKDNAPSQSVVSIVNRDNYQDIVLRSEKTVIILVSADWCPPCKVFKYIYNSVAFDFQDTFTFVNIDYDTNPEFVKEQEIEGVPMLLVCRQGKIFGKGSAFMSKDDFVKGLNTLNDEKDRT